MWLWKLTKSNKPLLNNKTTFLNHHFYNFNNFILKQKTNFNV